MAQRTLFATILSGLMFVTLFGTVFVTLSGLAVTLSAQVPFERLREAAAEPENWLTYSGDYFSQRYSALDQITPANVGDLSLQWVYQTPVAGPWQTTPLVVDGVMYLTQRPNDVVALDARTGRVFWIYRYPTSPNHLACCGANNRGVAVLGDKVFMATLDAHVVAIDATTGVELWDVCPSGQTGCRVHRRRTMTDRSVARTVGQSSCGSGHHPPAPTSVTERPRQAAE